MWASEPCVYERKQNKNFQQVFVDHINFIISICFFFSFHSSFLAAINTNLIRVVCVCVCMHNALRLYCTYMKYVSRFGCLFILHASCLNWNIRNMKEERCKKKCCIYRHLGRLSHIVNIVLHFLLFLSRLHRPFGPSIQRHYLSLSLSVSTSLMRLLILWLPVQRNYLAISASHSFKYHRTQQISQERLGAVCFSSSIKCPKRSIYPEYAGAERCCWYVALAISHVLEDKCTLALFLARFGCQFL